MTEPPTDAQAQISELIDECNRLIAAGLKVGKERRAAEHAYRTAMNRADAEQSVMDAFWRDLSNQVAEITTDDGDLDDVRSAIAVRRTLREQQ